MSNHSNVTHNDSRQPSRQQPTGGRQERQAQPMSYFTPMSLFYRNMDRVFSRAWQNFGSVGLTSALANPLQGMMFAPKLDISMTDKEYTVDVEIPGLSENDIRLNITREGQLCISGEKRMENEQGEKEFKRVERAYGSFSRTLPLPEDVDQENIQAHFNNGVLTITAPRVEASAQGKRIEITTGENPRQGKHTRQEHAAAATHPKRAA